MPVLPTGLYYGTMAAICCFMASLTCLFHGKHRGGACNNLPSHALILIITFAGPRHTCENAAPLWLPGRRMWLIVVPRPPCRPLPAGCDPTQTCHGHLPWCYYCPASETTLQGRNIALWRRLPGWPTPHPHMMVPDTLWAGRVVLGWATCHCLVPGLPTVDLGGCHRLHAGRPRPGPQFPLFYTFCTKHHLILGSCLIGCWCSSHSWPVPHTPHHDFLLLVCYPTPPPHTHAPAHHTPPPPPHPTAPPPHTCPYLPTCHGTPLCRAVSGDWPFLPTARYTPCAVVPHCGCVVPHVATHLPCYLP